MTKSKALHLSWASSTRAFWKCPPKYRKLGYPVKTVRLPGYQGDGRDEERATLCQEENMKAESWLEGPAAPAVGSWRTLIQRYKADEFSPIHDIKPKTRELYLWLLDRWDKAIGSTQIIQTDYERIRRIERAMKDNGRSKSYIKRMFTMLRTVTKYGVAIGDQDAERVSKVLSAIRFSSSPARSETMTHEQVDAFVAEASARGLDGLALGVLFCAWFAFRPVDVFGQWVSGTGGISRNGKRWEDGLTWDMIAPDFSHFTKVISKTEDSLPEPITYDLTPLPEIQERLRKAAEGGRVGPVVVCHSGQPYEHRARARAFRRVAKAVGIPDNIQMRDIRAGVLTDTRKLGVEPYIIRDLAGHTQLSTTDRYLRGRHESINNVVKLRKANS